MINVNVGVRGRYKMSVQKNGVVLRETPWFDNLITNQGMNLITTSNQANQYCQVGSSSVAPAFTDVGLGSFIAGVLVTGSMTPRIDSTNRYAICKSTFTFSNGAAAGNISEVGVGTAATGSVLFSRALVLDSAGNPTTITVLAGEDLVVIYELWIKQPTTDFTSVVGAHTLTIRSCNAHLEASQGNSSWGALSSVGLQFIGRPQMGAHTGAIGSITAAPAGTLATTTSVTHDTYVADSWSRTSRITWSTSQANFDILSFSWGFGPTYWQAQLGVAITKNNTQTFRLGVKLTWSRDSGPA